MQSIMLNPSLSQLLIYLDFNGGNTGASLILSMIVSNKRMTKMRPITRDSNKAFHLHEEIKPAVVM